MDANGHLHNWTGSQDGDKRGTASPPTPVPSYFELVQRCVEENVNEEERGDFTTAGLVQTSPAPYRPALPHNKGRKRVPCVMVTQCQFSKVIAGDATRPLSNQEASRCLPWFF